MRAASALRWLPTTRESSGESPSWSSRIGRLVLKRRASRDLVGHRSASSQVRQAYRDFGKTSGHAAKLNFGDCFSYALAKAKGEPLLFKGQDFSQTDVKSGRA